MLRPRAALLSGQGSHYRPEVVYRRKSWADVPAVRNGQVHCISEAYLGRPGPRLVDGVLALRQLVQQLQEES